MMAEKRIFAVSITKTRPCNGRFLVLQFFTALKMIIFRSVKCFDSFLIFAKNIDCVYALEPP